MKYHISTGLIVEKFNEDHVCPLCEIKNIVENGLVYEFLNDAVMEDNTRILVNKTGFCAHHFDLLFSNKNKLSLALQVSTRTDKMLDLFNPSVLSPKKKADQIDGSIKSCVICNLIEESMVKYYKTVAQMYYNEPDFYKTLIKTKGFCVHHFAELLRYSNYAKKYKKEYVDMLYNVQKRSFEGLKTDLNEFCYSHDYRKTKLPASVAEEALKNIRIKLYGKKSDEQV
jgi:hypothetical protein